jgi:hypothetical protein
MTGGPFLSRCEASGKAGVASVMRGKNCHKYFVTARSHTVEHDDGDEGEGRRAGDLDVTGP